MTYTEQLVAFVKVWEGLKLRASGDPLAPGVRDIGYGHVLADGERLVEITESDADAILRADLDKRARQVEMALLGVDLLQHEFDAVLSIVFNIGIGAMSQSTMFRRLAAGDKPAAGEEFIRWCRAGGREVAGLLKRRLAEQRIYVYADYSGRP